MAIYITAEAGLSSSILALTAAMKVVCFFLVLVAAVVADKVPDFMVPGKCPAVDTEGLWKQQRPQHSKVS